MTRVTRLKLARVFEKTKAGIVKRKEALPTIHHKTVDCFGCGKPMQMKFMQVVLFHKECRQEGRKALKKHLAGKQ